MCLLQKIKVHLFSASRTNSSASLHPNRKAAFDEFRALVCRWARPGGSYLRFLAHSASFAHFSYLVHLPSRSPPSHPQRPNNMPKAGMWEFITRLPPLPFHLHFYFAPSLVSFFCCFLHFIDLCFSQGKERKKATCPLCLQ